MASVLDQNPGVAEAGLDADLFLPDDNGLQLSSSRLAADLEKDSAGTGQAIDDALAKDQKTEIQSPDSSKDVDGQDSSNSFVVPKDFDWTNVVADFDATTRTLALAAGRFDSLKERESERVAEVAAAKGREGFRSEVENVLEKLQQEAHERSVGAFEKMLTAIAQDVQPISPITIKLELTTERNMPALDIYGEVRRTPKEGEKPEEYTKREDLTSGALTNVVSTGLRFITLARSGNRRFLVLDEADCWIETKDVQNFFNVVNQLSRDAGIQTVIITHHDLSGFEEDFRIYKINEIESQDQWKKRTPELISAGQMQPSEMQHDVLSFVELKNFEAYTNAHIDLAPGVTAITGINRGSKSAWARAFRSAFLGEGTDSNIRHGQAETKVAIGFSDGRVLEYNRRKKGNPIADYIMHTPESWEFSRGNPLWQKDASAPVPFHNSPVAKTPNWVPVETGVGLIDGVNVQLWGQLSPVFMLNETASKKASLLSIGRESGYLFAMTEINKEDIATDNKIKREGEKEIFTLRANMEPYVGFLDLQEKIESLRNDLQILLKEDRWLSTAKTIAENLDENSIERAYLSQWKGLEKILPKDPLLVPTEEMVSWLASMEKAKEMQSLRTEISMPSAPEILDTTGINGLLDSLQMARSDAEMKGRLPNAVSLPEIENTTELQDLIDNLVSSKYAARLKGQMPEVPEIPEVMQTASLQDHVDRLAVARIEMNLPLLSMPEMPLFKRTQPLEQWSRDIDQANVDKSLPRIQAIEVPQIEETRQIQNILDETARISTFLNGCRAQSMVLKDQFENIHNLLEKASSALGYDEFKLPEDVATALAEGAVLSHGVDGSREKVVAHFEKMIEQIQISARKGYINAMEKNLNLPVGFLEKENESSQENVVAVKKNKTRP